MKNLLIAGDEGFTEAHYAALRSLGFALTLLPDESAPCPDPARFDAVVGAHIFEATPPERFTRLRFVQTTTAGLDHVPVAELARRGVALKNARGVYSVPIAEFILGGVLTLYKHLDGFRDSQRAHVWRKDHTLRELCGKTVCVVGAGSIGTETAKRFAAMDCRILGVCRHPAQARPYFDELTDMAGLDAALGRSDIAVLTIPLDAGTRGFFGAARFAAMKDGAVFCNVARGGLVDTAALVAALQSAKLSGAVLDVTDPEPLDAASPLWDMENVVLSPHISYEGEQNTQRLFEVAYGNLKEAYETVL